MEVGQLLTGWLSEASRTLSAESSWTILLAIRRRVHVVGRSWAAHCIGMQRVLAQTRDVAAHAPITWYA